MIILILREPVPGSETYIHTDYYDDYIDDMTVLIYLG